MKHRSGRFVAALAALPLAVFPGTAVLGVCRAFAGLRSADTRCPDPMT